MMVRYHEFSSVPVFVSTTGIINSSLSEFVEWLPCCFLSPEVARGVENLGPLSSVMKCSGSSGLSSGGSLPSLFSHPPPKSPDVLYKVFPAKSKVRVQEVTHWLLLFSQNHEA